MAGTGKVVRAGVGRRRIQTLAMALTTLTAVSASVLALALIVGSRAPFEHAFAAQRGAQLTVRFDGTKASADRAAATAHATGVSAAAGPYPTRALTPSPVGGEIDGPPPGVAMAPMTIVGRAGAGGAVDELRFTDGKWATGPGQIVMNSANSPFMVGARVKFADAPGSPTLTVVGLARSVTGSADAWVLPAELTALTGPSVSPDYQMLYRFTAAATDAQVVTDRAAIAASAPPGSVAGVASYLTVERAADRDSAPYAPFVVAFGIIGLAMSLLIIGIVVSGAVGSATRRIGILKSLGFTPAQVVRAYLAQALIPATVGTVLGVVLGNVLASVFLGKEGTAYGNGATKQAVPVWIDAVVPLAALVAVAAAALIPAARAGRLHTVAALAVGRTPQAGRGRLARRILGALPLPRSVSLGLSGPFARPGRALTMAAAVMLGTLGVTFGVGLASSLNGIQTGLDRRAPGDVVVYAMGAAGGGAGPVPPPPPPAPAAYSIPLTTRTPKAGAASDPSAAINAAIAARPGAEKYFSTGQTQVGVAGRADAVTLISYTGDSSWGAYQMVSGHWFSAPGQAVVPSGFLTTTGTHIGDDITLTSAGHTASVRIVGEVLALANQGMMVFTDSRSTTALDAPPPAPSVQFEIKLKPGTNQQAYVDSLNSALTATGATAQINSIKVLSPTVLAMDSLVIMLTLMLVAVAGLGVFTTVVLDTRERVHDLGVYKSLGMTPRQTLTLVVTSVSGIGLLAGALGVPAGVAVHDVVVPSMGRSIGTRIPAVDLAVYSPLVLVLLGVGGLVIAVAGALVPAGWAARARTAIALRSE